MEGMDKARIVLWVLGQPGTSAGGVCQGCPTVRFDAPGGVGWGEESGDEGLFGAQGVPPETRVSPWCWGDTHTPLFHAGERQAGTGTVGDPQMQVFGWEGWDSDGPSADAGAL